MAGLTHVGGARANSEAEVDGGGLLLRPKGPNIGTNGGYRTALSSGLIAGVAAGGATAGHLACFRWTHATKLALIQRLIIKWATVTGFTAAQEIGMDAIIARSYSAAHTGGTSVTIGATVGKKRTSYATTQVGNLTIASTAALTAGTHTLDANPFAYVAGSELAAAATVPKTNMVLDASSAPTSSPIVLAQNEGIIVRNGQVAMGAGGAVRLCVEIEWDEVDAYAV